MYEFIFIIGRTLDFLGKIMIAYTAIRVHHKVLKDQAIDEGVIEELKHESKIGIWGVIFMAVGYIIEVLAIFIQ